MKKLNVQSILTKRYRLQKLKLYLLIIRFDLLRLRDVQLSQLRFEIAVHLQFEEGLGNANLELVGLGPAALDYLRVRRQHLKEFMKPKH